MKNTEKALTIKEKRCSEAGCPEEDAEKYPKDKKCSCEIEISLSEYSELAKRALKEGSTPEAMIARRIAELVGVENP